MSLALLATAVAVHAQDKVAPAPDFSGKTDASIREVVRLVARHQLHPLKDGDYAPVSTIEQAMAARPPSAPNTARSPARW